MGNVGPLSSARARVLAVLITYVVGLALLVFGPWGWGLNRLTVWLYVQFRYHWPITPDWALPEHYGLFLNVLLFVPVGAVLVVVTGRSWWWVTVLAAAGSGVIEATQGLWLVRETRWSDVLTNTAGALLGALVVSLSARVRRRSGSRSTGERRR